MTAANERIQYVLNLTKLNTVLPSAPSYEAAVAALRGDAGARAR
jgi:hypothetical protein